MGSHALPMSEHRTLSKCSHLAISEADDDAKIRAKYRPFLLEPEVEATDWISELELETVISMVENHIANKSRLKVLVLYGSLRKR
jgi:arsenical resistance protein ArsH